MTKRHPADVTADRLIHQYEKYYDDLTARERDAFGTVIQALREIPEAKRTQEGPGR